MKYFISLILCSLIPSSLRAEVIPSPLISDHMVVQADHPRSLWGKAAPGENISVSDSTGAKAECIGAADGTWRLELPALKSGTPFELTIKGANTILIHDAITGEVWLGAGQSNMVLPVKECADASQEIASANAPTLRFFWVPQRTKTKATEDLEGGSWRVCTLETVGGFSGTAYYFARELQKARHCPVGMIVAAFGGTPITAWLSSNALQSFEPFRADVEKQKQADIIFPELWKSYTASIGGIRAQLDHEDKGLKAEWFKPEINDSEWPVMQLPCAWDDSNTDLKGLRGVVWFRKSVEIPAAWKGRPLCLFMGLIKDYDQLYVNGVQTHFSNENERGVSGKWRHYIIDPANIKYGEKNLLVSRITSLYGKGGLLGGMPFQIAPADPIPGEKSDPNGIIGFTKTDWHYQIGIDLKTLNIPDLDPKNIPGIMDGPGSVSTLSNAMIYPVRHYPIKGVLWYQGESAAGPPAIYGQLLTALANEWRGFWAEPDMTFLVVQLPNIGSKTPTPKPGYFTTIRDQQTEILKLPKTGLAVTIGTEEGGNLHPKNKQDVGARLALLARRIAYSETEVSQSPQFQSVQINGATLRVTCNTFNSSLKQASEGAIAGFEIAGPDHLFLPAQAHLEGKDTIVLTNEKIPSPTAARYAWSENPETSLLNLDGLPLAPFSTESTH